MPGATMEGGEVYYTNDSYLGGDGNIASSRDGNGNGTIDPIEKVSLAAMIFLPIIIIVGVFGNTLVCIAVVRVNKLRTVANSFVVSLAISDLCVCVIVLPLGLYEALNYGEWHLGDVLCNTWLSLDVILSTASVWNLCAIAGDRWLAITKPIWYANRRSPTLAGIALAVAWGIPILLTIPSMVIMGIADRELPNMCYLNVQYSYVIFACIVCFFLPCVLVLAVYVRIFMAARDHFMRKPSRAVMRKKSSASSGAMERSMDSLPDSGGVTNMANGKTEYTVAPTTPTGSMGNINAVSQSNMRKIGTGDMYMEPSENRQLKRRTSRIPRISVSREKKAAIVLSIVVGAFIICWLPYFTAVLVFAASGGRLMASPETFVACSWIGWINSIINPIIYTIFTKEFRKGFKKILKCECESLPGMSASSNK